MTPGDRTLLLSLRPRFAEAILSGAKTVELRRRPINAQPFTPIILYASSPTMAIVGTARLGEVQVHKPAAAWRKHRQSLSLSRSEFDLYLDGSSWAYVLLLEYVCVLNEPLSLRTLRQEAAFQPPQSFRYVAASDPGQLHGLIPTPKQAAGGRVPASSSARRRREDSDEGRPQASRENVGRSPRPGTVRKPTTRPDTPSASPPAQTPPSDTKRHSPIFKIADS